MTLTQFSIAASTSINCSFNLIFFLVLNPEDYIRLLVQECGFYHSLHLQHRVRVFRSTFSSKKGVLKLDGKVVKSWGNYYWVPSQSAVFHTRTTILQEFSHVSRAYIFFCTRASYTRIHFMKSLFYYLTTFTHSHTSPLRTFVFYFFSYPIVCFFVFSKLYFLELLLEGRFS